MRIKPDFTLTELFIVVVVIAILVVIAIPKIMR
jgi:Tfp pilus assembly protein FimT